MAFTFMFWETKGRTESVGHICPRPINPICLWLKSQYVHQRPKSFIFCSFWQVNFGTLNKLDILILTIQPKIFMVHVAAFIVAWPLFPYSSSVLTNHGDNLKFQWKARSRVFSIIALVVSLPKQIHDTLRLSEAICPMSL